MNEKLTSVVNCKNSTYDVYIGRGSLWGNQFKIGEHGSREQVIVAYRDWLLGVDHLHLEQNRRKKILRNLSELKGKILGCWCKPSACHGDVLVELINKKSSGLILVGGFEFPNKCPENCVFKGDFARYVQGSICVRCPIFNCAGKDALLPPEGYRKDWAKSWHEFFKGDMKEAPHLPLFKDGDE